MPMYQSSIVNNPGLDVISPTVQKKSRLGMKLSITNPTSHTYVPSTQTIFTTASGGVLSQVSPLTKTVVNTITPGACYHGCYNPENGYLYVSSNTSAVWAVDPVNLSIVATISVVGNSMMMAYCPSTKTVWVGDGATAGTSVSVINSSNAVVATLSVATGANTFGLVYVPTNNCMYVQSYRTAGAVTVFNASSLSVVATISVPTFAGYMTYNPENNIVYLGGGNVSCVWGISPVSNAIVSSISTATSIYHVAYNPSRNAVYAVSATNARAYVINPSTNAVVSTITTAGVNSHVGAYVPTVDACFFDNSTTGIQSIV